jgi:hypothetical protein
MKRSETRPRAWSAAALAALLVAACAGSPLRSSVPSSGPWATFESDRDGYSLGYPADWSVAKATVPWRYPGPGGGPGSPSVDQFTGPDGVAALVVTSQAIPSNVTEAAWWSGYLIGMAGQAAGCAPPLEQWATVTIDGHTARLHGGLAICDYTEAVALVGRRAYVFTAYADVHAPTGKIFDRDLFNALLATAKFHPEQADDSAPAGPSPS